MSFEIVRRAMNRPGASSLAIALGVLVLLIARRPAQLLYPEVWVEEGTEVFPDYVQYGAETFLHPVNGYLITPTKVLNWLAIHLSFEHYPVASYVLALLFSVLVALAIYKAPTVLPAKTAMALAPFLIPTNAEVYATGHYIFWIVGLLSPLPLVWRLDGSNLILRVALTILGALSCPIGVALTPLYAARALWQRTPADFAVLAAALVCAAIQIQFISATPFPYPTLAEMVQPVMILEKFVGDFVINVQGVEWLSAIVGAAMVIGALAAAFVAARRRNFVILALGLCCAIAVGASVLRAPVPIIDAHGNAPRHFFYPFVFLSWLLVAIWCEYPKLRRIMTGVFVVAFLNGLVEFSQWHPDLAWENAARACRASSEGSVVFDIHYDGRLDRLWKLELGPETCRRLSREAIFG